MQDLLFEIVAAGVARITINRPQSMNAMSRSVRNGIARALIEADSDPGIAAIILTGAGDKAFSASLDIKELDDNGDALREVTSEDPLFNTSLAVDRCRKPIIAAINGVCINGALEVALACDIIISSENARFCDTHVRVGYLPGWGLSQRLSRSIGLARAKEMSLTCRCIDAATAERWGLVNRVVPFNRLQDEAVSIAQSIAGYGEEIIQATKSLMDKGFALSLEDALRMERSKAGAFNFQN